MVSRALQNEVCYAIRMYLSSIPTLRASAEQRSDFQLLKAEVFELMAGVEPSAAAQMQQIADKAKCEAHTINLDY